MPDRTDSTPKRGWSWFDAILIPVAIVGLTPLIWNLGRIVWSLVVDLVEF